MPDSFLGIPYEYYLILLALLMILAAFKSTHNKIIARVSVLSFSYTLLIPILYGFDRMSDNPFLKYSFGFCLSVFLIGGFTWMVLELSSINPFRCFSKQNK